MVSYFSKVSILHGNIVKYSFHIKNYINDGRVIDNIADTIATKTGLRFSNSREYQLTSPYFGVCAFNRNMAKNYTWSIKDSIEREKLVSSLKMLEPILAGLGLIDPIEISTKNIWSDIVRQKNKAPLLVTGEKVYELTLREDLSGRPVKPTEAFQQEVLERIENIKVQYEEFHQEEMKALQEKMDVYSVPFEDFINGYSSFIMESSRGVKTKCLCKQITYYPTHIMFSSKNIRQIKKEEQEKK